MVKKYGNYKGSNNSIMTGLEYHKRLRELQDSIAPFNLTIREMAEHLGLRTTSSVFLLMQKLVDMELAITRQRNGVTKYYLLEGGLYDRKAGNKDGKEVERWKKNKERQEY